jgi:SRSO17 transposase
MSTTHKTLMSESMSDKDGILIIDGCDIPKKGDETAGGARQHCGPLGKIDNCLAFAVAGYSSRRGYRLIESRQYLQVQWTEKEFAEKRKKTGPSRPTGSLPLIL